MVLINVIYDLVKYFCELALNRSGRSFG